MTELLTRYNKFCVFICIVLAITFSGYAQTGNNDTSQRLPVFDLNSSHLFQLTGSESAPEGNYSIVEEDDDQGGTYISALPMQFTNGQWQENPQGIPYLLNSQDFPDIQNAETYLQSQNLFPVNEPQGFPVFDLNSSKVTNLTNGAANQAGHYAVVDANQSFVDLEPVEQDGNGSWIVTPADDYVNLVPSRFSDFNATKAWFDANASAPVAILPFDNNHSQPSDHNQSNPGSGGNHNSSTQIAVFDLNSTHLFQLTGSESAPEGNYSIVEEDDDQGGTYISALPMQFTNGQWQENPQGIPYLLNSQDFPDIQNAETYLQSQNLFPVNEPQGLPVYTLTQANVDSLVGANVANAGTYAIEIWTEHSSNTENKKLVRAIQDENNDWFKKENSNGDIEQYDLVPSYDSFDEVISYISSQNLTPSGHIIDEEAEHHGPFNFTIIDEIDLNIPQELIDLSADHDDVWFQRVNLEDGRYIWTLSVENDDENGSTSESSNLMVEMNGSVYEGDFHAYWRDKFEIDVENNSSSNWRENRFDTNESGISELYLHYPEIRGANAHFDFSIIDEIDLNNPQELIDLSADHDDVWFQRVNLEDGRYIWALSVENDDENGSTSESSNLMVEMNGSVYEGDFHDYWRDAFDIMIDNNSTNWREDRFDANPEGIKNLLFQFPEIRGPNAPVSPMVKTDPPKSSFGNKATFVGKLITDGNNRNLSLGFQFSEDLRFNDVIEVLIRGDNFEAEYDFSKYESKYLYYRAFARNEEFESFGARKRLKIDVLATTKINGAKSMEGGWESSVWFGHYYIQENGWIYHEDLGWCFLVIQKNNHWLWMEKYGWLWTKPSVWPYLYDIENADWLYLLKRKSGPSLFFDRKIEQFLPIRN